MTQNDDRFKAVHEAAMNMKQALAPKIGAGHSFQVDCETDEEGHDVIAVTVDSAGEKALEDLSASSEVVTLDSDDSVVQIIPVIIKHNPKP